MSEFDPYDFPYRRGEFKNWAPPLLKMWHPTICKESPLVIKEEIVYTKPFDLSNQSVCIVGGGGSVNRLTIGEYDHYWSMNSFFKNEKVSKLNLQLVGVGAGVDLHHPDFIQYCKSHDTVLAFEIHPAWEHRQYNHFENRKMCYHTALYGRIGMGIRLIQLAAELGAETVAFIGLDGPEAILKGDHAFEPGKTDLPSLTDATNAHFIHKHQYDFCWQVLVNQYPFTKFISIDKENKYHEYLL